MENSGLILYMHFSFLTLFPEFFGSPMNQSIIKRAKEKEIISWDAINIRDFSIDPHKRVDDTPYGGLSGMLMQAEPVFQAIEYCKKNTPKSEVIFFSPSAPPFTQKKR